ncbi:MAG: coenzyme F420-0:L-glutamate ligase, partial [Synergistaceae bacterium]
MMRYVGTVARGIRLPVVVKGQDLVNVVADSIMEAALSDRDCFSVRNRDVIGVTESLLARSQGNYVSLQDISNDVRSKLPEGDAVILFPIMSRNRFRQLLRGIVNGVRGKVHVIFSYPSDEVGNKVIEPMNYYLKSPELSGDCIDEDEFYRVFGEYKHPFTGVDYVQLYKEIDPDKVIMHFANNPLAALNFSKNIIVASIHTRKLHKTILEKAGATVLCLDEICTAPCGDGKGYN